MHTQVHTHVTATKGAKPTIVLVHGAWADASSFAPVTTALQRKGYPVVNAPNPLRSVTDAAANVAAFVNQKTTGPVVLVGHSYGGPRGYRPWSSSTPSLPPRGSPCCS